MKTLRTRKELFAIANDVRKKWSKDRDFDSDSRIYVPLFLEDGGKPLFSYYIENKSSFVIPVAEFSNLNNEKLFLEIDGSNIEGDLEIYNDNLKERYKAIKHVFYATKKGVETAVENIIGIKVEKDESDMLSWFAPDYSNAEEIRVKSEEILKDMNFILNFDNDNIRITTNDKVSVAEISIYDTGCDSFGDVCTNKQVILFFYETDKYNF